MHSIAYFFGGIFFTNAIPHFVAGSMGEPFQTPFAKPSGIGLSSSKINILWAWFNILLGYLLIFHVGTFDLHSLHHVLAVSAGGILISLFTANHFGALHGGNL